MKRIYEIGDMELVGEPEEFIWYLAGAFFMFWVFMMIVQVIE